jgi:DNA-binding transcriptional MocR family regulator
MSGNEEPGTLPQPARHTRLDGYVDRYAARTHAMKASEIRALFAVASRPEVVSLAGGMPNISGLPLDAVAETLGDLVRERGTAAMQYGSGQGDPRLREQICEVMAIEGIRAHPDDVVVTVGSQQAVDLVTRVFCDPGDVVLCEAPSYVGALGVFGAYECDVVHVEMDDDGLVPTALEQAVSGIAATGRRPKFLYTIPTFHNPAGVTLSTRRRVEILDICRRHDLLVLEDNPYGLLGFDAEPMRAMRADEPEQVVYLGSFSKTFAPGFRVGWALAPHAVREKLVLAQESATLCPPSFSQQAISAYLSGHDWRSQIKDFTEMYRERRDAMLAALDEHLTGRATWTVPAGGFYVWLTLPEGLDAKAMLPRAVTARVAYVPGTAFYADGFGSRCMRLSFCYPTPEQIHEGVRRLAAVIAAELELRDTFGAVTHHLTRGYEGPQSDLS